MKLRKISNPPVISGFVPYGTRNMEVRAEIVALQFEEYEALRLCDYEMLNYQPIIFRNYIYNLFLQTSGQSSHEKPTKQEDQCNERAGHASDYSVSGIG